MSASYHDLGNSGNNTVASNEVYIIVRTLFTSFVILEDLTFYSHLISDIASASSMEFLDIEAITDAYVT